MHVKWKTLVAAAAMILAPAAANAQGARSGLILSSLEQAVAVPVTKADNFSLLVDLSDRTLYALSDGEVVRSWPVSVGQEGYNTPAGQYRISHLIWNPRWVPPSSDWARDHKPEPPGAVSNPMGRVKMFFREPDLYIHGTRAVDSLGEAESHGCVRMRNSEVIELARTVMANGGSPRPPSWFRRVLGRVTSTSAVYLSDPVMVEIHR